MLINWENVKKDYVEGIQVKGVLKYPSLRDLCKIHCCSLATIKYKCSTENWVIEREEYKNKIKEKRFEKKTDVVASEAARFDTKCLNIANAGLTLAARTMKKLLEDESLLTLKPLKRAMEIAKLAQGIGKLAVGDETEIIKNKVEGELKCNGVLVVPDTASDIEKWKEQVQKYYSDYDPEIGEIKDDDRDK